MPPSNDLVESAWKWLIQQRFKGGGPGWGGDGFNHLLMRHVAWADERFDILQTQFSLSAN